MAVSESQFKELKREVENAKTEADRAQGALSQLVATLKNEFGCKTPGEAKEKLAQLRKEADTAEQEFETALKTYRKEFKNGDEPDEE